MTKRKIVASKRRGTRPRPKAKTVWKLAETVEVPTRFLTLVAEEKVKPPDLLVFCVVKAHVEVSNDLLSHTFIGQVIGWRDTERVRLSLVRLQDASLLTWLPQYHPDGRQTVNRYRILD